jgi:hypothetical protein
MQGPEFESGMPTYSPLRDNFLPLGYLTKKINNLWERRTCRCRRWIAILVVVLSYQPGFDLFFLNYQSILFLCCFFIGLAVVLNSSSLLQGACHTAGYVLMSRNFCIWWIFMYTFYLNIYLYIIKMYNSNRSTNII